MLFFKVFCGFTRVHCDLIKEYMKIVPILFYVPTQLTIVLLIGVYTVNRLHCSPKEGREKDAVFLDGLLVFWLSAHQKRIPLFSGKRTPFFKCNSSTMDGRNGAVVQKLVCCTCTQWNWNDKKCKTHMYVHSCCPIYDAITVSLYWR
jgi:hypothetical protein